MVKQAPSAHLLAAFATAVLGLLAVLFAWPAPSFDLAVATIAVDTAPDQESPMAPPLSLEPIEESIEEPIDEPIEESIEEPIVAALRTTSGERDIAPVAERPTARSVSNEIGHNDPVPVRGARDWSQFVAAVPVEDVDAVVSDEPITVPVSDDDEPAIVASAAEDVPVTETVVVEEIVVQDFAAGPEPIIEPQVTAPTYVSRGQDALSRLGFDLASIGYSISFHPENSSYRGLTFTQRRHIEVYVRPSMSNFELAYVIGHEMGHAVDHILNTPGDRARWRAARGMASDLRWWPTGVGNDLRTPAGDFSECFAAWVAGSASHSAWGSCAGTASLVAEFAAG